MHDLSDPFVPAPQCRLTGSYDTLYQSAAIPSTVTTAMLSFWLHIDTAEIGSLANDTLTVQVRGSSGAVLATLATYTNLNAALVSYK